MLWRAFRCRRRAWSQCGAVFDQMGMRRQTPAAREPALNHAPSLVLDFDGRTISERAKVPVRLVTLDISSEYA